MARILIAEDEESLSDLLAQELAADGHDPVQAYTGQEALEVFGNSKIDLAILDVMLPAPDGFEICRQIRAALPSLPVLMLTARDSEIDRVVGLEIGADDYIVKPFSVRELLARVRTQLRKAEAYQSLQQQRVNAPSPVLRLADCTLDPMARLLTVADESVILSKREFDLFEMLMRHPGRVLTRAWLLETLWGDDYEGTDRTVDTHVQRLRDKLGRDSAIAARLTAVRGVGYRLESD